MSYGQQCVQVAHAVQEFTAMKTCKIQPKNSLIVLTVNSEKELWEISKEADHVFREADFCDELTAAVFIDGDTLSHLPLSGKEEGCKKREAKLRQLSRQMAECYQTENQNVLEHGSSVREKFVELWDYIENDTPLEGWRVPEWVDSHKEWFLSIKDDIFAIEKYLTVHDCGKPFVEQEEGKRFPNYAAKSREVWSQFTDDELVLDLIERDSVLHIGKAPDALQLLEEGHAPHLLLAALSELHANADMFGGITSQSFVIKYKNLCRRGKTITKHIE